MFSSAHRYGQSHGDSNSPTGISEEQLGEVICIVEAQRGTTSHQTAEGGIGIVTFPDGSWFLYDHRGSRGIYPHRDLLEYLGESRRRTF
jgi:hypothetical protein